MGRGSYNQIDDAYAEVFDDYGLSLPEFVTMYQVVLKVGTYTNNAGVQIAGVRLIEDQQASALAFSASSHNSLTDRSATDQHPISAITGLQASLDTKANTSGSNATGTWAISVSGNAATATSVTWSGILSTPTTISGYGITDAITTANIGSQSVNYATTAGSASTANSATTATNATSATSAGYLNNAFAYTNGGDGWFRSTGAAGWYNATYSVGIYATEAGNVRTYGGANFIGAGNVTAYSDERVKTNWRSLPSNFIEHLANLKSGIYDRTDIVATQVGVGAQSLQKFLPEAIVEIGDKELSVAYGNAALVAAVELAKEVVLLRKEIEELKKGN
jgi:hypothetical protein